MKKQSLERIENSGLTVIDTIEETAGIKAKYGWYLITSGDITPDLVIDLDVVNHLDAVNSHWFDFARETGVINGSGEFLISIPGDKTFDDPWYRVRITGELELAQSIFSHPGEPEFVTAATDGSVILGVTSEEDGTWIIVVNDTTHNYTD